MTRENNPLEIGLGRFCSLDGSVDYLGRDALVRIAAEGVAREMRGVVFDGPPCPTCSKPWPVMAGDRQVGRITSAAWSPRLERNVGLSLIEREFWDLGRKVSVRIQNGTVVDGQISALPFA